MTAFCLLVTRGAFIIPWLILQQIQRFFFINLACVGYLAEKGSTTALDISNDTRQKQINPTM